MLNIASRSRGGRLVTGLIAALLFTNASAWAAGSPAESQPQPAARPAVPALTARLIEFPASVGPQDSLRIGLRVTNSSQRTLDQLRVAFSIYEPIHSRSRLEKSFRGSLGSLLGSDTIPVEGGIEPGASRNITVDKPLSEISAVRSSREDGAYPVRIAVRAEDNATPPIDTQMIFFTAAPLEPLSLSLIIPLHSPSIYTDGRRPRVVTSNSLEKAISTGRLARILDALEHHEVPVTLAPSGLLLDMLDDLAGGYWKKNGRNVVRVGPEDPAAQLAARTLARLRLLAARPATKVIPMPYSAASLGALVNASLEDLAQAQVVQTRSRLSDEKGGILSVRPEQGWLLPVYRSLNEPALSAIQRSGVNRIVLSPSSLRSVPAAFTRGVPARVETRTGPMVALIEDDGLKRILDPAAPEPPGHADGGDSQASPDAANVDPMIVRQRFLADTATIMLERPSLKRAVVAVAPPDWDPAGPEVEGILASLGGSVWMRGVTVDSIPDLVPAPATAASLTGPEAIQAEGPPAPPRDYFLQLREARRAIQKFAELAPPPERLADLQRRLLIAESADWWGSRSSLEWARTFARAIPKELAQQTRSIQAPGAQVITLTSQTGVIPLSVASRLKYPVDVVLKLDSDKLTFPDGDRIPIQKLQAPARTIEVRTIAQATGTFPLRVRVQTSAGTILSEASLTIRSTAYNVMAVSITAGAALFLLAWWVAGRLRRRAAAQ